MSREDLLLATLARELCAPEHSLSLLLGAEVLERSEVDEPQSFDTHGSDEPAAREARYVIGSELHDACGVARADVGYGVDFDFVGCHGTTRRLPALQSVRRLEF
jgi:hypothetical protein